MPLLFKAKASDNSSGSTNGEASDNSSGSTNGEASDIRVARPTAKRATFEWLDQRQSERHSNGSTSGKASDIGPVSTKL
jgi:hypothetical protein